MSTGFFQAFFLAAVLATGLLPLTSGIVRADEVSLSESSADKAIYGDDERHPIPYIDRLDIVAAKRTKGVELVVVIASPLHSDDRSMKRLMRKLDTYCAYIASPEYREKYGDPRPQETTIRVLIDARSDSAVFDWLETVKPLTNENRATLIIEKRSFP